MFEGEWDWFHQGYSSPEAWAAAQKRYPWDEVLANARLNQAGSVMGSDREGQRVLSSSPALGTIYDLLNGLNPINWMGGFGGAGAAGVPMRAGKTFKPAAETTLASLIQKIAKGEASMPAYTNLSPAYRNKLTGEIAAGGIGGSHASVSDMLPQSWLKNMEHGYKHPAGPFIADEWYSLLRDPKMSQKAASLLERGIKPDAIFEALKFANPSSR